MPVKLTNIHPTQSINIRALPNTVTGVVVQQLQRGKPLLVEGFTYLSKQPTARYQWARFEVDNQLVYMATGDNENTWAIAERLPDTVYSKMGIVPDDVQWLTWQKGAALPIPIPNPDIAPQKEIERALINVPPDKQPALLDFWRDVLVIVADIPLGDGVPMTKGAFRLAGITTWIVDTVDGKKRRFETGWDSSLNSGALRVYKNGISSINDKGHSTSPQQHGDFVVTADYNTLNTLSAEIEARHKFDTRTIKDLP